MTNLPHPTVSTAATADSGRIRIGATARPVPAPAALPPAPVADAGRIRLGATARPAG